MASTLFEKTSLSRLRFHSTNKPRPIRIMVIGQRGVGKTALVVRFITSRFIGDYDSSTDKVYNYRTLIDNELISFEIIDSPGVRNPGAEDVEDTSTSSGFYFGDTTPLVGGTGTTANNGNHSTASTSPGSSCSSSDNHPWASTPEADRCALEKHIQHADAFIIMYSVTDQCSFEDCSRLRFLINYNSKQRRRSIGKDYALDIPVILVGNKKDQKEDRMVDVQQGKRAYREMSCAGFHEISVRESAEEVWNVFRDLCRCWRIFTHYPKLKRSTSDAQTISYMLLSPDIGQNNGMQQGTSTSSVAGGYFDGWLKGGEKRPSFFGFRSNSNSTNNNNGTTNSDHTANGPVNVTTTIFGGSGSSSSSSTQQSPSADEGSTNNCATTTCASLTASNSVTRKLTVRLCSYQHQQHHQQNLQQLHQLQLHQQQQQQQPFRERASTDGKILSRPRKWQYMSGAAAAANNPPPIQRMDRRMSISQRGSSGY